MAVTRSVALTRVDRDGTATDVRYRGPLLAEATDDTAPPADDDVSTVAAQELGRMMATADAHDPATWRGLGELGVLELGIP